MRPIDLNPGEAILHEGDPDRCAVLLPGVRYFSQAPLLWFARTAAQAQGWSVLEVSEPDEQVAAAVEDAAAAAAAQAANVAAAELGAHAVRLTPTDEGAARHRRAVAAVGLHLFAGDAGRARADAERLLTEPFAPRERADSIAAWSTCRRPCAVIRTTAGSA